MGIGAASLPTPHLKAEREGFEPSRRGEPTYTISNRAP